MEVKFIYDTKDVVVFFDESYKKGEHYSYTTEIHEEGQIIYCVICPTFGQNFFNEINFNKIFDKTQEIRRKRLKTLLG